MIIVLIHLDQIWQYKRLKFELLSKKIFSFYVFVLKRVFINYNYYFIIILNMKNNKNKDEINMKNNKNKDDTNLKT